MNIAIYLRKSRGDDENSLKNHKDTLFKLAKDKNLNILKIKEEIVSGEKIINRPKMLELLNEVEKNLYDAVLVMDIDRLGRGNMQDQGIILSTFKDSNTKIITPRKIYDLNNEWDEEYSEFEAFMARKELKIISRRMQQGRLKAIEEGHFLASSPPFGYDFSFNEKGRRILIINKENAKVVKMIFNMYKDNNGASKISSVLNKQGYKSANGNNFIDKTIRDIIKNKVYCGYVTWNKKNKNKDTLVSKGYHEPIITEELWNICNSKISKREISPNKNKITNPLAGIVKCELCGHTLVAKSAKMKKTDLTPTRYLTCTYCLNRSSKLYLVEEAIIKHLKIWLDEYKIILNENDIKEGNSDIIKEYRKQIKNLENNLSKLEKQKDNLHDLLEQGVYDVDTYIKRANNIKERVNEINKSVEEINSKINIELGNEKVKIELLPEIENVLEQYEHIDDNELKNKLLKTVLDKVVYSKNHKRRNPLDFKITLYPKLPR